MPCFFPPAWLNHAVTLTYGFVLSELQQGIHYFPIYQSQLLFGRKWATNNRERY